jgi:hypothetical protein
MKTKDGGFILDDRHQIFNIYASQCAYCRHFIENGYQCSAFPLKITDGRNGHYIQSIPDDILSGESLHEAVRKGQEGNTIFEPNERYKEPGASDFLAIKWNLLR